LSEWVESGGKKVGAAIRNRASNPNILSNARYILEHPYKDKSGKM